MFACVETVVSFAYKEGRQCGMSFTEKFSITSQEA
jgi:hypothetical protein